MKSDRTKKIAFIFITVIMSLVAIDCLLTQPANEQNITTVKGHFKAIEVGVAKGDTSYCLYINENQTNYKISADWSGCFQYHNFINNVKQGDELTVSFKIEHFLGLFNSIRAVSVVAGDNTFMSVDCVNFKIEDNRFKMPLMCLLVIAFIWGYWFLRGTKLK
ncbi:hypothetical protein JN11_00285 [Mucilaginibacter frigoritolerans]|uniref:Uncharacterized protein n=1 Tax=Mucilaginibacter frigoritolerans TaxID=652788 RepID=A0A562UFQ0_9SPHI|nr:hypothetical protein [Mucilaginibacter frigoritolerans]TWJ04573.1 hypothetical protein JN11_00285 [Mucilaginibacter frigoritolerans]